MGDFFSRFQDVPQDTIVNDQISADDIAKAQTKVNDVQSHVTFYNRFSESSPDIAKLFDKVVPTWRDQKRAMLSDIVQSIPGDREKNLSKLASTLFYSELLQMSPDAVWSNYDKIASDYRSATSSPVSDWKAIVNEYERGSLNVELSKKYNSLKLLRNNIARLQAGEPGFTTPLFEGDTVPTMEGGRAAEAKTLKEIVELEQRIDAIQVDHTDRPFLINLAQKASTILPSVVDALPSIVAGGVVGGAAKTATIAAVSFANSFVQEGGAVYGDLVKSGVPHQIANDASNIVGALNGAIETVQLFKLAGLTDPVLQNIVRNAVKRGTNESIRNGILTSSIGQIATRYVGNIGEQAAQEAAQETISVIATNAAKAIENERREVLADGRHKYTELQIQTAQEALNQVLGVFADSVQGFVALGLPGAVIGTVRAGKTTSEIGKELNAVLPKIGNADPRIATEIVNDVIERRAQAKREQFAQAQTNDESKTRVTDSDGNILTVYHGAATADGRIHWYSDPGIAAENIDALSYRIDPETFDQAVRTRYGDSVADYVQKPAADRDAAIASGLEISTDSLQKLSRASEAIRTQGDMRGLPESVFSVTEELGLPGPTAFVIPANIDARAVKRVRSEEERANLSSQDYAENDAIIVDIPGQAIEVITPDARGAVTLEPESAANYRLPKVNGEIVSTDADGTFSAIDPKTKRSIESLSYETEGDISRITSIPNNPKLATELLTAFRKTHPNVEIDISPDARIELLRSSPLHNELQGALDNLYAKATAIEEQIRDIENAGVENSGERLAELSTQAENIAEQIAAISEDLDLSDREFLGELSPDIATATTVDYTVYAKAKTERQIDSASDAAAVIAKLAPQIEKESIDAAVKLMEIRAARMGLTFDAWKKLYLKGFTLFEGPGNRGSTQFLEDGSAIVAIGPQSDATTLVHEIGHIIRRQLPLSDQTKLLAEYNSESWDRETEEKFASDWENYFYEGKAPNDTLRNLFVVIKHFFTRVYQSIVRPKVSEQVRHIFDKTLIEPRTRTDRRGLEYRDPLTDIPNRRALDEDLAQFGPLPGQASLDGDSLKWVNDTLGHDVGDAYLRSIASALSDAGERYNVRVYRSGGDEFWMQGESVKSVILAKNELDKLLNGAILGVSNAEYSLTFTPRVTAGFDDKGKLDEADRNLKHEKLEREARGDRARRAEPIATIRIVDLATGNDITSPDRIREIVAELSDKRDEGSPVVNQTLTGSALKLLRQQIAEEAGQDSDILYQSDIVDPSKLNAALAEIAKLESEQAASSNDTEKAELGARIGMQQTIIDDWVRGNAQDVQRTIESGQDLDRNVVEQYEGQDWANDYLSYLDAMDSSEITFLENDDVEPTVAAEQEVSDFDAETTGSDKQEFSDAFIRGRAPTRAEANDTWKTFVRNNSDSIIQRLRGVYRGDKSELQNAESAFFLDISWGGPVWKAIHVSNRNRYSDQRERYDRIQKEAVEHLAENGDRYRLEWARFEQDTNAIQQALAIDYREPLPEPKIDTKKFSAEQRIEHIRSILQLGLREKKLPELDELYTQTNLELKRLTREYRAQNDAMIKQDERFFSMERAHRKTESIVTKLERELSLSETVKKHSHETAERLRKQRNNYKKQLSELKLEAENQLRSLERRENRAQTRVEVREHVIEKLRDALVDARKEARIIANNRVEKIKEQYKAQQQYAKIREYKENLIRRIMSKVGKGIDFEYAEAIRNVQERFDPNFRGPAWQKRRELTRAYFKKHPELWNEISDRVKRIIEQKSPDEIELWDLEMTAREVASLRERGAAKRRLKEEAEDRKVFDDVNELIVATRGGQDFRKKQDFIEVRQSFGPIEDFKAALRDAHTPQAMFDRFDGYSDYKGGWMQIVYNRVSDKWSDAKRYIDIRMREYDAKLKELNIDLVKGSKAHFSLKEGLVEKIEQKGFSRTLTLQESLGVFMLDQMGDGRQVLEFGFRFSRGEVEAIKKSLPKEWKSLGNWIIEHGYGDYLDRYREAFTNYMNEDLEVIERYSPLIRFEASGESLDAQMRSDLMRSSPYGNKYVDRSSTKSRTMRGKYQKPVRLDALNIFREQVEKQEHFIYLGNEVKHFNKVFATTELRETVRHKIGPGNMKQADAWLQRVANPDIFAARDNETRLVRRLRSGAAMAYLGFNLVTAVKSWITGPLYSMAEAPGHVAMNLAKSFNPVWIGKAYSKMITLSPEMKARTFSRAYAELARENAKKFVRLHAFEQKYAYVFLTWGQRHVDTVCWSAVFDKHIAMGFEEKAAAREATNFILRTQPTAESKDISALMGRKDFLSVLTQFAGQQNQLWNELSPLKMVRILFDKNRPAKDKLKAAKKFGILLAGTMMSGMIYAIFANRKPPESEEDWLDLVKYAANNQLVSSVPFVGPAIAQATEGYDYELSVLTPFVGAVSTVRQGYEIIFDGEKGTKPTSERIWKAIDTFAEAAAIALQKPYLAPKRLLQTATDEKSYSDEWFKQWGSYLLWGGAPKE